MGLLPLNFLMGEDGNRRGKEWKKEKNAPQQKNRGAIHGGAEAWLKKLGGKKKAGR